MNIIDKSGLIQSMNIIDKNGLIHLVVMTSYNSAESKSLTACGKLFDDHTERHSLDDSTCPECQRWHEKRGNPITI